MFKRRGQRKEFAERIPTKVVFLHELLHVLRCRTAGASFEQTATVHKRNDRKHLGARAEFHDGEQVGEVIAQHVAGDRNGVFTFAGTGKRVKTRSLGRHDLDREAGGVVLGEVLLHLGDDLRVVRTVLVEPEHRGRVGKSCTRNSEFHPVANRCILGLACTPDVAGFNNMFHDDVAGAVGDAHGAVDGNLKRLVVRTVFLGLLGHEADVGNGAHRGGVECAVGFAVVDDGCVHAGIGRVGNDGLAVLAFAFGIPHLSAVANHGGHGGVDDDVAWHVQVGDALIGIDHCQFGAVEHCDGDVGFDGGLLRVGKRFDAGKHIGHTVVHVDAETFECSRVLGEHVTEVRVHCMTEDDRVGDLHHRGLEVN